MIPVFPLTVTETNDHVHECNFRNKRDNNKEWEFSTNFLLSLYGLILDEKMAHTFNPSGFYPDQGTYCSWSFGICIYIDRCNQ